MFFPSALFVVEFAVFPKIKLNVYILNPSESWAGAELVRGTAWIPWGPNRIYKYIFSSLSVHSRSHHFSPLQLDHNMKNHNQDETSVYQAIKVYARNFFNDLTHTSCKENGKEEHTASALVYSRNMRK